MLVGGPVAGFRSHESLASRLISLSHICAHFSLLLVRLTLVVFVWYVYLVPSFAPLIIWTRFHLESFGSNAISCYYKPTIDSFDYS